MLDVASANGFGIVSELLEDAAVLELEVAVLELEVAVLELEVAVLELLAAVELELLEVVSANGLGIDSSLDELEATTVSSLLELLSVVVVVANGFGIVSSALTERVVTLEKDAKRVAFVANNFA